MKNILISALISLMPGALFAGYYDNAALVSASDLKPLARDIGGLLGSGSNQTARSLGFSGFDIGLRGAAQLKPSKANTVFPKERAIGMAWVQGEIGMPFRIDGFVRAGAWEGMAMTGGGLRYGLRKLSDEPYYMQVMLVGMANFATNKYFYAQHYGASLVCSVNVPYVAPYLAAGFDSTRLVSNSLAGKSVSVFEPRYTFGLRSKLNLGYLSAGVTLTHGRTLVQGGAGIRF